MVAEPDTSDANSTTDTVAHSLNALTTSKILLRKMMFLSYIWNIYLILEDFLKLWVFFRFLRIKKEHLVLTLPAPVTVDIGAVNVRIPLLPLLVQISSGCRTPV